MRARVTSSGIKTDVTRRHHATVPEHKGRHLWIVLAMFAVTEPARERHDLDMENLVSIEGPGCYHCEQPYRPGLGARCPGEPVAGAS